MIPISIPYRYHNDVEHCTACYNIVLLAMIVVRGRLASNGVWRERMGAYLTLFGTHPLFASNIARPKHPLIHWRRVTGMCVAT